MLLKSDKEFLINRIETLKKYIESSKESIKSYETEMEVLKRVIED